MGSADFAKALATWLIAAGIYDQHQYEEAVWNKTKDVMDEFVDYMDDGFILEYGTACGNAAWVSSKYPTTPIYGHTVGDTIVCVLMVGALFFMNWGTRQAQAKVTDDATNDSIGKHIKCIIVHMFSQVLNETVCPSERGTFYAWHIMEQMGREGNLPEGLIKKEKCGKHIFAHGKIGALELDENVRQWLREHGKLKEAIQKVKGTEACKTVWQKHWKLEDILGTEHIEDTKALEVVEIVKELKEGMNELFTEIAPTLQKTLVEGARAQKEKLANDGKNAEAATTNAANTPPQETTAEEAKKKTEDGKKSTEGSTQDDSSEKAQLPAAPSPTGRSETSAADAQVPTSPSVPPPAPPPPPSRPSTPSTEDKKKDMSEGPAQTTPKDSAASVSVTFIQKTPSSECSGTDVNSDPSADGPGLGTPAAAEPAAAPAPPGPPVDTRAGSSEHAPNPTTTSSESTPSKGTDTTVGGPAPGEPPVAVVDGGNDDPPPLNPPKPKPNPNPNQSGATGSSPGGGSSTEDSSSPGSPGHQTPGSSGPGSTGTGSTGTLQPGTTGDGSTGVPNPGSSGPGSAGTGTTGQAQPGGSQQGPGAAPTEDNVGGLTKTEDKKELMHDQGTSWPGLTWEDVKPYTPAIIPAVVGIGVIAFFLWKYFAHLAKPRRTYRTVRDVPSPPLDEDILDHLQRGDAPPPDYGYTVMRAPRRDTFADRRAQRPPRVHKRTIIELHLEVLHECEATEWESVKEDYWKIVVEEFAQEFAKDLMRDEDTYNNILGVSTSNHGLPGNNVSSTDSKGTDPCPPNDCDPWSCMENIQFATDPCPPNADDPHPSSCMQPIHLAMAPCQPNKDDPDPPTDSDEPDAWKCMETIQLPTDPCPPNADDPDPWKCMETIQLAPHPCPPNADDPWNCMETIQFATAPCPPNADDPDPWNCMETIQLEQQETPALFPSSSDPGNECATPDHINWIPWIHRNKHILRECTGQTWFLQLKADWTQYLRAHMATNEDNVVSAHSAFGEAATMERQKLRLWKQWVAQQHRQVRMYCEQEWFQHLLHNVEEKTVPAKGDVPRVEKHLEVENVNAAQQTLRVRDVPRTQPLHPQLYLHKPLSTKIWILILALVLEHCELERSMQQTELYVDALLQNM
ncbi:hypothetical protein AK88_05565 [Plasmodium fragile]|uniref:Schizont-infected cell agglutination C-terminal domain-containing protein n=1 Tax=Plasmodium fragile TaxID=5857 RepID=A0A0D9QCM6_PLAFR|nr:uncharacterized protein AK88_05565 [Plasmodium fragile]KJP84805.1 hypothetical protein AK88_05565 [Plasmodium fragile]